MGRKDEDMTLKLGDDVLLHILSFLPTRDALRTSVLSTRWRYLWASFSSIDLENSLPLTYSRPPDYPSCRTSFLHFVDRLVLVHDDSDIIRFKVSCDVHVDAFRVYYWISAVINHNVKELHLHFPLLEICILPSCLFSSRSLTMLSIDLDGVLRFPSSLSADCPFVKRLNFSKVKFFNEDSTKRFFLELFAIFPILEQLSLVHCGWKDLNALVITGYSLESITMDINDDELLDCKVVVMARYLTSFHCRTDSSIDISLTYTSSLEDASLEFTYPGNRDQPVVYERLVRLFGYMEDSESLTLSTQTLSALLDSFESLPVLDFLTSLHISGFMMLMSVEDILEFMQKTPDLEYLSISLSSDDDVDDWFWSDEDLPPGFLMNKLKKLKFSRLDTIKPEVCLINYFLENACNLEKIEVCAHKRNAEKLERIRNEVVALPRFSEKCALSFEVAP